MSELKENYISRYQARVQHKISLSRLKAGIESGEIRAIWRGTRLCDVSAADVIRVMKTPHNHSDRIADGDEEYIRADIAKSCEDAAHMAGMERAVAEVERLRAAIKAEAEYCYGMALKYSAVDEARANRHRERGDRLMGYLEGGT